MEYIGEYAFAGNSKLESITFPGSAETIRKGTFFYCEGLKNVTIGEGVKNIEQEAFNNCESIENLKLPETLDSIGIMAFYKCRLPQNLIIPNSVTYIAPQAFAYWWGLKKLTLGRSLIKIEWDAFGGSDKLDSVYCLAETPPEINETTFNSLLSYESPENFPCTLFVPIGSKSKYMADELWSKFFVNIVEIADDEFPTHIKTVTGGEKLSVNIDGNTIIVSGNGANRVEVYTIDGQLVYSGTQKTIGPLAKGIYIVKCGNKVKKISL